MYLNRLNRMKPLRGLGLIDAYFSIDMNALWANSSLLQAICNEVICIYKNEIES